MQDHLFHGYHTETTTCVKENINPQRYYEILVIIITLFENIILLFSSCNVKCYLDHFDTLQSALQSISFEIHHMASHSCKYLKLLQNTFVVFVNNVHTLFWDIFLKLFANDSGLTWKNPRINIKFLRQDLAGLCYIYGCIKRLSRGHLRRLSYETLLIITQVLTSKVSFVLQSALKMFPLLVSQATSFCLPLHYSFSHPSLSKTQTKTRYLLSHSTHLLSHINKNKILELPLSLFLPLLVFIARFLLSICSADERRLWSLSVGV